MKARNIILIGSGVILLHWIGFLAFLHFHGQTDSIPTASGCVYNETGRDSELLKMIKGAKKTIFLKTGRLDVAPIWDALAAAGMRGVGVELFCPNVMGAQRDRIVQLASAHGTVMLDPRPEWTWSGTVLFVDGDVMYSASDLSYAMPGVQRSYVRGKGRFNGI